MKGNVPRAERIREYLKQCMMQQEQRPRRRLLFACLKQAAAWRAEKVVCNLMKRGETLFKWVGCTGSLAWQLWLTDAFSRRLLSGERRETVRRARVRLPRLMTELPLAFAEDATYLYKANHNISITYLYLNTDIFTCDTELSQRKLVFLRGFFFKLETFHGENLCIIFNTQFRPLIICMINNILHAFCRLNDNSYFVWYKRQLVLHVSFCCKIWHIFIK